MMQFSLGMQAGVIDDQSHDTYHSCRVAYPHSVSVNFQYSLDNGLTWNLIVDIIPASFKVVQGQG